jgi:hypothetical protein
MQMSKRFLTVLSLVALGAVPCVAAQTKQSAADMNQKSSFRAESPTQILFEAKAAAWFFGSKTFRNVYGVAPDLQLSASGQLWKWVHLYGSVEYLWANGKSLVDHQKTRIWMVPLSLGPKFVGKMAEWGDFYFTVGPRYFPVNVHNHSNFVDKKVSSHGLGGFANAGFLFYMTPHWTFDIFGEASYAKLHFHSSQTNVRGKSINVGGYTVGGGFGYDF